MLYLAQVIKNKLSHQLELDFLAYQTSDSQWELCEQKYLLLEEKVTVSEGNLILVEISEDGKISKLGKAEETKDWVLNLIRQYLTDSDTSPKFLEEEHKRIERWRQELTAKSQKITQIQIEQEIRTEQLQELAQTLDLEKKKLKEELENLDQLEE